jgi:hypothetical protein
MKEVEVARDMNVLPAELAHLFDSNSERCPWPTAKDPRASILPAQLSSVGSQQIIRLLLSSPLPIDLAVHELGATFHLTSLARITEI